MQNLTSFTQSSAGNITLKSGKSFSMSGTFTPTGTVDLSGATVTGMTLSSSVVAPDTTDGAALGSTSLMWSDLFLASGAVVNFNNGDVTLTHSSNNLAIAGGNVGIAGNVTLTGTTSTVGALDFSGITTPADAGNYGNTINSGWVSIDPGSGGSFGAKLMFSNTDTSGYTLYGLGLHCRTNAAGAVAVGLNVSASTNVASSGGVQAIQGYCQINSTYTVAAGSANACTALYGKTLNAATNAAVCSALWVDEGSTTKATTHYLVDLTCNGGAIVLDSIFHVYTGTQTAALLFKLEGTGYVTTGTTKSTPGVVNLWLNISHGGTSYFVPCYASTTT